MSDDEKLSDPIDEEEGPTGIPLEVDLDDDIDEPIFDPSDEFAEDYELDTGGVNFHDEDTDQNY